MQSITLKRNKHNTFDVTNEIKIFHEGEIVWMNLSYGIPPSTLRSSLDAGGLELYIDILLEKQFGLLIDIFSGINL